MTTTLKSVAGLPTSPDQTGQALTPNPSPPRGEGSEESRCRDLHKLVEEKLFQNRYRVDTGHAHIRVKDETVCDDCTVKPCTVCCPAGCWRVEGGRIELVTDGCLECGTCRIVCEPNNVDWNYPRGGFGILFKFG